MKAVRSVAPLGGCLVGCRRVALSVRSASAALRLVERAINAPKHEIHENLCLCSYYIAKVLALQPKCFFKQI